MLSMTLLVDQYKFYQLINVHRLGMKFIMDISIAPFQVYYYSEALPTQLDTVSVFHAEAPQATVSEGLAQGPYVAPRAGFEPTTLWSTAMDSTNEPPLPRNVF